MALKKEQFILEIPINASPSLLYELFSSSNGLQEWFADKVDETGDEFTFTWGDSDEYATKIADEENLYTRFQWDYQSAGEYFEFYVERSPITNQTILRITDYADKFDMESQKQLWHQQVNDLKKRIGS